MVKLYLSSDSSIIENDPYYRYQIEYPIFTNSIKSGTKITVFENSQSFSKALNINDEFLCKFISNKLSCQLQQTPLNYYFKGHHNPDTILSMINNFIKIYILCPNCDLPETNLFLDDGIISHDCESCGQKNNIISKYQDKTYDFIKKKLN